MRQRRLVSCILPAMFSVLGFVLFLKNGNIRFLLFLRVATGRVVLKETLQIYFFPSVFVPLGMFVSFCVAFTC